MDSIRMFDLCVLRFKDLPFQTILSFIRIKFKVKPKKIEYPIAKNGTRFRKITWTAVSSPDDESSNLSEDSEEDIDINSETDPNVCELKTLDSFLVQEDLSKKEIAKLTTVFNKFYYKLTPENINNIVKNINKIGMDSYMDYTKYIE